MASSCWVSVPDHGGRFLQIRLPDPQSQFTIHYDAKRFTDNGSRITAHGEKHMFLDREEAGQLLAGRLGAYKDDHHAIILALPRGGVPVALVISQQLHIPLDVLITRKLGAPGNPEYAMGAIAETGYVYLNDEALQYLEPYGDALQEHLNQEVERQKKEIARRIKMYRDGSPLPSLKGKTVLLVDDGVATGSTFLASLHALHDRGAGKVVAAIPVGPRDTVERIEPLVSELVVLEEPENFQAVGLHYRDFSQVDDEEVCRYLEMACGKIRAK